MVGRKPGHSRGLRYAVVTLEGVATGKAVEREAVHELDNLGCRFSPHVQAASVGQWLVIKNNDPFEILATNPLSDSFSASPILAGQALYLRGERFLYCIARNE